MNINHLGQLGAYQTQLESGAAKKVVDKGSTNPQQTKKSEFQTSTDKVSVSANAVLRTEAYQVAAAAPDVRQDRVNEIQERLASGTYNFDPYDIAERLIQTDQALFSQ